MPHSFIASLLKLVMVTVFSYTVAFILLASSSQSVVPVSDSWRHFPNPAAPLPSLVLAVPQLEADEVASAHARVAMAVAHGGTVVCLSKKVEFLRLQNGSDIRGVAVARIEESSHLWNHCCWTRYPTIWIGFNTCNVQQYTYRR
uniref:Uncharacterized protein n=1 Tax=Zea mays TaxID=4577 RepID=A0A804PHJ4_MAIZE